jgi:hypothetical protein
MKVGDLVRVVPKEVADIRPFSGRVGLLAEITHHYGVAYYNVLMPGNLTSPTVAFRKHVLEVYSESR